MSENFSGGNVPNRRNTTRQIEVKILNALNAGASSGGAGLSGVGSPQGVLTASPGATYLQTDTNSFWAKNSGTGNTGWVELLA